MCSPRSSTVLPLALLLLLVVVVASGCGAKEKQDYIKDVNRIQGKVNPQVSGSANDPKALDRSIKAIDSAIDDLEKLDVPDDYRKPHGQMVEALGEMRDELTELKTADPAAQRKLIKRNASTQKKYESAIKAMNDDR